MRIGGCKGSGRDSSVLRVGKGIGVQPGALQLHAWRRRAAAVASEKAHAPWRICAGHEEDQHLAFLQASRSSC